MNRRRYLAAVTSGAVAFGSGCLGAPGSSQRDVTEAGTASPDSESVASSSNAACDDSSRFDGVDNVAYDELGPFALDTDADEYDLEQTVHVRLMNRSDDRVFTGVRAMHDVQTKAETEWRSMYRENSRVWTLPEISHRPGGIFTWDLNLSVRSRGDDGDPSATPLICEPFDPGEYRFVFVGVDGDDTDVAGLATEFRIVD